MITSPIQVSYLFEYLRELNIDIDGSSTFKALLLEDIKNKNSLPDYKASIQNTLNALLSNIREDDKKQIIKDYIDNKI